MIKLNYILMSLLCLALTTTKFASAQNAKSLKSDNRNLGITICEQAFNVKIKNSLELITNNTTIAIDDLINMARLCNTIDLNIQLKKDKVNLQFRDIFIEKYLEVAVDKLNAKLSKGMGYYSKKYDIDLGGHLNSNSIFAIVKCD